VQRVPGMIADTVICGFFTSTTFCVYFGCFALWGFVRFSSVNLVVVGGCWWLFLLVGVMLWVVMCLRR
jgi:hypothetical protein